MRLHLFAALAVAGVLAAGCGPATNYKYRIAVIPKGMTHEFWQSIHRGADRAAADLGKQGIAVFIDFQGPNKENDSLEQINLIKTEATTGIQGMVLAPQDSKQMVPPVQQVVDKHIPVLIIDSGLDKEALDKNPHLIVKYVATNNYHGGQLAAMRLLDVLDRAGVKDQKIILFRYAPGSESTEQREKGFHDVIDEAIKNHKPGAATISWLSDDQYAGATVSDAETTAGPLLDKYRNEEGVGIFAVNESAAAGMLNKMKALKLRKHFKYVGFDSSDQLLNGVRDGDIDGLIVQDPYRMGYLSVWTLVQHLEGYDVSEGGRDRSTGEHVVTHDPADAPPVPGGERVPADVRGDVDDDKMRELWKPDLQSKRTTEELLKDTPQYKKKS
jgi:ribose transport system substrate-binding protein